jgi:hypothetical protein
LLFSRTGKRSGFKKMKYGNLPEPKKESTTKPAVTAFFVNDGNFMERFRQMQGLSPGMMYKL